jgi:integrase
MRRHRLLGGRQEPRDRVLTDIEMKIAWHAAERVGGARGDIVKTLMVSGLRLREAANIADAEFEQRDDGQWLVIGASRMKAKRMHCIPVGALLGEIIAKSKRRGQRGLVFTMCSGRPVVGFSLLKREIDTAAAAVAAEIGVAPPAPWTLHDIRRSARTRWSASTCPTW